jgi:hypothetical protein
MPVDLFMRSEQKFGVKKLPTLVLLEPEGTVSLRIDGPMQDPAKEMASVLAEFTER